MNKRVLCAAVLLVGLTACTSGNGATAGGGGSSSAPAKPEVFGVAGYRGLTPGMTKDAALATGKLAGAPSSNLDGCADFAYTDGPVPDPTRMAAEDGAQKKARELNAKADELDKTKDQRKSAKENADAAQVYADAAMASAELAEAREARNKAFAAAGGASFGKDGLRELGAPASAKTAEGIGAGSTVDELKKAYESRGLKLNENIARYQLPIADKAGWSYEFTATPDNKVGAVSIVSSAKCV
nr:hypothetical protein [Kibdelosporangium sp. MJ126-NF4]